MELVQAGVATIVRELDLELHLVSFHGHATHRTRSPDPRPAPGAVRPATRKLSILNDLASDLSKDIFVHLAHLERTNPSRMKDRGRARCQ